MINFIQVITVYISILTTRKHEVPPRVNDRSTDQLWCLVAGPAAMSKQPHRSGPAAHLTHRARAAKAHGHETSHVLEQLVCVNECDVAADIGGHALPSQIREIKQNNPGSRMH